MTTVAVRLGKKAKRTSRLTVVVVESDDVADIVHSVEVVEIRVLHGIVNETTRIERAMFPPGKCLDADNLG